MVPKNAELEHLITLVRVSDKPVREVLENYFKATTWSLLKDEWNRLSSDEKHALIDRLEQERR